jgi:hypothetical protein
MRLQIHVAVDPNTTSLEELTEIKQDLVRESMLAVRDVVARESPADPERLKPNIPPLNERWAGQMQNPLRASVSNDAFYAKYLLNGNHPNGADGMIHPLRAKFFRFRSRATGDIIYAKAVHPIDPNNIFRTVPRPYSFRRDVVEYAMEHGSEHAINVMGGKEAWRGVLAVRLTRL